MKAFLVGLLFLLLGSIFVVLGILLSPFLFILAWIIFVILAIWLLGKIILYLRERKRDKRPQGQAKG